MEKKSRLNAAGENQNPHAWNHNTSTARVNNADEVQSAVDPFASPYISQPSSAEGSTTSFQVNEQPRYFKSRRVEKGAVERPWLARKDPKEKWLTIIPLLGIFLGIAISGVLVWDGLRSVINHEYCPVLSEDWSHGINEGIWVKEAEVGGFGNGQFEETTVTDENVFIRDGMLHIQPTLQDQKLIDTDGSKINLTQQGICASPLWFNCVTSTNHTNSSIVNPVKSGRISTRPGAKIKYGRVEVVAKLPAGDWLWPAIWMLPVEDTYGAWPRSGEIDIMESRGNNWTFGQGGNDIVSSTLHFGPNYANDGWWTNNVKRKALHTTYSDVFHTFGLEWSEKYLFTYVDTRLLQVMYNHFNTPLFAKGHFPLQDSNGTKLTDPWAQTGRLQTPFDQDFYLILNVAVGGTNGWFEDGKSGKPWVDGDRASKLRFWEAKDAWLPTWEKNSEMVVKSVKMWQQKGYNGC